MNICNSREYGLSGTEPVINQERMLVREKVDERQFEWYRDNKILLPSQRATGNVVF